MAIEYIPYRDADDLARAEEKGFYPVDLPISHWQLRYYISNPEPDVLYYASGTDVYCLNTVSKKRKHIATVPFTSRCTASGHGWVCVGGENEGQFAAIKLDGSAGPRALDVDSALPIDSWRTSSRRGITVNEDKIGGDYLNSISIHRIQDEEAHLDDIVAIVTNNDKTVRIYSLPQGQETTVLDLPFAMNHATLSPDGQVICAVGDVAQAYFFARELNDTPPQIPKPHNRLTSASLGWTLVNVVNLHVSGPPPKNGYFTTAWSPNGRLVAVGSEMGFITIFDVEMLMNSGIDDADAVVSLTPTTRADDADNHGAVRQMVFSPEPWDLLVWTEDAGRVCIGDLRTGLRRRQVIDMEPRDRKAYKEIVVEDLPSDDADAMETDYLRYQYDPEASRHASLLAGRNQDSLRRDRGIYERFGVPSRRQSQSLEEDTHRGLTAREEQILETVRTTRQREEARANGRATATVNYTTPDMFTGSNSRSSQSNTPTVGNSRQAINDLLGSVHDTLPELSRTSASTSDRPGSSHGPDPRHDISVPPLHLPNDSLWVASRRNTGLVRLSDSPRHPRRSASIILALPNPDGSTSTSRRQQSLSHIPNDEDHDLEVSPHPEEAEDEANVWRTIEDHMTLARGPLFESAARAPPLPADDMDSTTEADRYALSQVELTLERARAAELQADLTLERSRARTLAQAQQQQRQQTESSSSSTATTAVPPPASGANATRIAGFPDGYGASIPRPRRYMTRTGFSAAASAAALSVADDRPRRRVQSGHFTAQEVIRTRNDIGPRTAGLAISADGRILWAACEEGIFEVPINLKSRMFWAAVDPL